MKLTEKENRRLKNTIKKLRREIKAKNELIQEYERSWSLKLFNDLETILNEYSVLLNPAPVVIKSSYKNRGYLFEIKPGNVITLFSKGRTKALILNEPIPNQGSAEIYTDIVYTERGFLELANLLDKNRFLLCQISRSCFVNLQYYNLGNNEVVTKEINNKSFARYSSINITRTHKQEFVLKKNTYQHVSSLQKDQLRDILQSIIKGLNSFTI